MPCRSPEFYATVESMRTNYAILLLLTLCACSPKAPEPGASDTEMYPPIGMATPENSVVRLTESYFTSMASKPPVEMAIPVDAFEPFGDRGVRINATPFRADAYTECTVRLKATGTRQCRLTWRCQHESSLDENPGISFGVSSDGQFHDYTVDLTEAPTWAGGITAMAVTSDEGTVELESCTLRYVPPRGPARTTLDHVTMESLALARADWMITVPKDGMLEAHAGLQTRLGKLPEDAAATFTVTLEQPEKTPVPLIQYTVDATDKGWSELRADLTPYAGQDVTLVLRASAHGAMQGVVPLWGNPMIASRAQRGGTPIILISCDTTRADHLGCYGYERDTSPNIDAFAREAVVFENAFTPETCTLPAHTTMLTGLYPTSHLVTSTTNLAEDVMTLPETLRREGYTTGAFTGYRIWLQPNRGLAHGFDRYSTPAITRDLFTTLEETNAWLDTHANAPFFLFFHNYDHHSKYGESKCEGCDYPYYPPRSEFLKFAKEIPEPESLRAPGRPQATNLMFAALEGRETLTPEEIEYAIALYDDSIRGVDHGVGELLDKLRALGVYDKAIIVITSDHGEQFGEHGQFLHEHLYEESARVPLIIRFPNGAHAGKRIAQMAGLIDIMPTLLEAARIQSPVSDGQSLMAFVNGEVHPSRSLFIRRQSHIAIRTPEWKLMQDLRTESEALYQVSQDPHEANNLLSTSPPVLEELRSELHRFFKSNPQGWHFAFDSNNTKYNGTLQIRADSPIDAVTLVQGGHMSRNDLYTRDTHSLEVTLGKLPQEEVIVRVNDKDARLMVRVESESPIAVQSGGAALATGTLYETTLENAQPIDPASKIPLDEGIPGLRIWFEKAEGGGTQAAPLTEEEKAELRGQGYVGEAE